MEDKNDKKYPIQTRVPGPRRAKMPLHRSRRWLADGENGRAPGIQVFLTQQAYLRINAHAVTDLDNEVGGWLAGRWCKDTETGKEFVVVEALLPAQQVRSGSTFLTFTHDSQVAMLAALEERYSKKGVVGWYHTHPRMGIFLSGYDTWLHDHFFPHPWQVALVVEPHSGVGGFFVRNKDNKLDPRKYYGFYELQNRRLESVVNWQNLHLEKQKEEKPEEKKIETRKVATPAQKEKVASASQKAAELTAKPEVAKVETKTRSTSPTAPDLKAPEPVKPDVKKIEVKSEPPTLLTSAATPKSVVPAKTETKRIAVRKNENKTAALSSAETAYTQEHGKTDVKGDEVNSGESQPPKERKQEIRIDVHNKNIVKKPDPKNGTKSSEEAKS